MSSGIESADLKLLTKEFPKEKLKVRIQSFNKTRTRALLIAYIQHSDVQDRLDQVDPSWSCHAVEQKELEHEQGMKFAVRMRMKVKGVERENVGEGDTPKQAYSDGIKRVAMCFGVGRHLYCGDREAWVPYSEEHDRHRVWTIDEFYGRLEASEIAKPNKPSSKAKPKAVAARGPGEYLVRYGKLYKGKKLKEIDTESLISYVNFMQRRSEDEGGLAKPALEFMENAMNYLSEVD